MLQNKPWHIARSRETRNAPGLKGWQTMTRTSAAMMQWIYDTWNMVRNVQFFHGSLNKFQLAILDGFMYNMTTWWDKQTNDFVSFQGIGNSQRLFLSVTIRKSRPFHAHLESKPKQNRMNVFCIHVLFAPARTAIQTCINTVQTFILTHAGTHTHSFPAHYITLHFIACIILHYTHTFTRTIHSRNVHIDLHVHFIENLWIIVIYII